MLVDVALVGAGFAGICAVHALARLGLRVALVERWVLMPDLFRAEKIESDQAKFLRVPELLSFRRPLAQRVGTRS
jgi:2-polyprenyl-6-methoxyphenol hydroxylase-like FAD-dependent oxidoreductase